MELIKTSSEFLDNLKQVLNIDTDANLARFLNISAVRVSNWRSRDTKDYDYVISKVLRKKPDFDVNLLFKKNLNLQDANRFNPIRVGAGNAVELNENQFITAIPVPDYLTKPGVIPAIYCDDSMYPRLKKGNIILIDTHQKEIISKEMYCLKAPHEGLVVKRFFKTLTKIIIKSDNELYPQDEMTFEELRSYEDSLIVGIVSGVIEFRNLNNRRQL